MSRVLEALAARPRHEIVLSDGANALSAGDVRDHIARLVDALACLAPGAVASRLDNGVDAILLDLALAASGRAHIALPPFFTEAQAATALEAAVHVAMPSASGEGVARRSFVLQSCRAPAVLPVQTAIVTYTSGSTGVPKGVCLDRALPERVAQSLADAMAPIDARRHLCLLPLGVLLETIGGVYAPLLAGGQVVAPSLTALGHRGSQGLDLPTLLATLDVHRPESLIVVPQLLQGLVHAVEAGGRLPNSLKMIAVGGARVPLSLLGRAQALGLPVFEGYGLSECASVVALNRPGAQRAGSVGRVLPHTQVRIASDGEILIDGPSFLGYTGGALREPGPWATGDLGEFDDEGFLHIRGRRKALYITAWGRNVSPEWVESELVQHPAIAQAFVWGEGRVQSVAVLVPRHPAVSTSALQRAAADVNAGLPEYARVGHVLVADAPFDVSKGLLTTNGRSRREALMARYGARMSACSDRHSHFTPMNEALQP